MSTKAYRTQQAEKEATYRNAANLVAFYRPNAQPAPTLTLDFSKHNEI